jgi:hypothetical protein
MGRHSAPDDDQDRDVPGGSAVAVDVARRGRHARTDEQATDAVSVAEQETERLVPPEPAPPAAEEPTAEIPAAQQAEQQRAPRVGKGNQSTAADLALLRARSDVRARVLAAVIAPFVIYTIVMYLIDRIGVYFIWVWVPLVAAGVLAGSILDAAHRKQSAKAGGG